MEIRRISEYKVNENVKRIKECVKKLRKQERICLLKETIFYSKEYNAALVTA